MQKPTFNEYLDQRLNSKERTQLVIFLLATVGACTISFVVKPEFGAMVSFVVGIVTLATYFYLRGQWLKSIS